MQQHPYLRIHRTIRTLHVAGNVRKAQLHDVRLGAAEKGHEQIPEKGLTDEAMQAPGPGRGGGGLWVPVVGALGVDKKVELGLWLITCVK